MGYILDQDYNIITDQITCLLAFLLCLLIKQTFIKNRKLFSVIFTTLVFIIVGCLSNMCWYELPLYNAHINSIIIYILKCIYYISNIIVLFLSCYYINYLSNYNTNKKTRVLYLNFLSAIICIVLQIITPITKLGYHLSGTIFVSTVPDPFMIYYVICLISILYMLIVNKKEIVRELRVTLIFANLVSMCIVFYNIILHRTSYITFTFLIPLLILLFLYHSNSYEYDTGALDSDSFDIFLKENVGNRYYYLFLKLFRDRDELPKELKKGIMNFYYQIFGNSYLFSLADNSYVLVISEENKDVEQELAHLIHTKFKSFFDKYHVNYNMQLIDFTDAFENLYEFKFVTRKFLSEQIINSYVYYTDEQVKNVKTSLLILDVLKDIDKQKNFNDKRVLVYCQPVKNIKTGLFDTAEALMRLKIPNLGIITPDKFIELAEQENLIHSLSMIILNKTCKAIHEMKEEGYVIDRISVNFSQIELRNKHFVSDVIDIIDTIGIKHDCVAIEVTENVNDTDYDTMALRIKQLKSENIYFYLDDFGTGYNNFDRMLSLKLNILKFDRSLLLYALKDDNKNFILEHFAFMFQKLGYKVLFEGVETIEQEQFCINSHADYIQGYLYSKPIPIDGLRNYLTRKDKVSNEIK